MAVRGVYAEEEKKILAKVDKLKGKMHWVGDNYGAGGGIITRVANRDAIRQFCNAIGDENPLWRDEEYARNTRWGGIIAPPSFVVHIGCIYGIVGGSSGPFDNIPPSLGQYSPWYGGTTYNFYKPIRVNDSFKVKSIDFTSFEDKTRRDGTGPRQWLSSSDIVYINQKDEVVSVVTTRGMHCIVPQAEEGVPVNVSQPRLPHYIYSKEEIEYIERAYKEWDETRGAEPRYWEDVNVGDELPPLIHGPRTEFEQACAFAATGYTLSHNLRMLRKHSSWVWQDPETGYLYDGEEGHIADKVAIGLWGTSLTVTMGVQTEMELMFLMTNWMGDDGFLKRFDIRFRTINPIEDVSINRGRVIRKYVENGEHLVDLAVWSDSIRGWVIGPGNATVSLPSRSVPEV